MFLRAAMVLLLATSVAGTVGCVVFQGAQDAMRDTWRVFRPKPNDFDAGEDPEKEWEFVGDEARPIHGHERDPDRWYKNYFMSPKANAIERNLGID